MSLPPRERLVKVAVYRRTQGVEATASHHKALSAAVRLLGNALLSARKEMDCTSETLATPSKVHMWQDCVKFVCQDDGPIEKVFLVLSSHLWDHRASSHISPYLALMDALGLQQAAILPFNSFLLSPKDGLYSFLHQLLGMVEAVGHFVGTVANVLVPSSNGHDPSSSLSPVTSSSSASAPTSDSVAKGRSSGPPMEAWSFLPVVLVSLGSIAAALPPKDCRGFINLLEPHIHQAWPALMALWEGSCDLLVSSSLVTDAVLAVMRLLIMGSDRCHSTSWWARAMDVVPRAMERVALSDLEDGPADHPQGPDGLCSGVGGLSLLMAVDAALQLSQACFKAGLDSGDGRMVSWDARDLRGARNLWILATR